MTPKLDAEDGDVLDVKTHQAAAFFWMQSLCQKVVVGSLNDS